MDYIYGVINQRVEKNIYKGNSTDTAQVIVNNDDSTISVNAHVNYDEVHNIVNKKIGSLNVIDKVEQSKFVTSVSEKNGLIEVKKSNIGIGDIFKLPERLSSFDERIDNLNYFWNAENPHRVATKVAQSKGQLIVEARQLVIEDIDKLRDELNSKADSKNAMHLLGTSTTEITEGGEENPTINGQSLQQKPSDVVIYKNGNIERKFICADDGKWHVLGSTNEFVRKDFINEDISDEVIQQSKVKNLSSGLSKITNDINQLQDSCSKLDEKIDSNYETLDEKIDGNYNTLDEKIDETKKLLDKKIDSNYKSLDKKIDKTKNSLELNIEQVKTELQGNISTSIKLLDDTLSPKIEVIDKIAPKFEFSTINHYLQFEFI